MYDELFKQITASDTILTPNRRLSAYLRNYHFQVQNQRDKSSVWLSPDILPISSWLERCWEESQTQSSAPACNLLTPQQEQFLWEQLLRKSSIGEKLLQVTATATLALQAWQLSKQWQLATLWPQFTLTEDVKVWQTVAHEYQQLLADHAWIDNASLPDWLGQQFAKLRLKLPKRIFLVGFDELTPQYQQLLQSLNIQTINYTHAPIRADVKSIMLPSPDLELQAMARWAHYHWQSNHSIHSIACVVPNLTALRSEVMTTFMDIFAEETIFPWHYENTLPFNISAGMMLNEYPLIQTALLILKLEQTTDLFAFGALLRSPYLGHAEQEMALRARIDATLRNYQEPYVNYQQILHAALSLGAAKLSQLLKKFFQIRPEKTELAPYQWAELFAQQLAAMGWPGERSLNSTEHQLVEAWTKLLLQFTHIGMVAPSLTRHAALQKLEQLAAASEFQPQSAQAPVQILGVLEAAGQKFTHTWVMGLNDQAWPPAPNPNPFIPIALQRQLELPHSSSQREHRYCQLLTSRLCQSAPRVILSYPHSFEDQIFRPSPLLAPFATLALADLEQTQVQSYATAILQSAQTEMLVDEYAPPLAIDEIPKGGASLFKHQADCPFRAFSRFRLGAYGIAAPETGLNARDRGSLLHHSLEIIWKKINSQEQLLKLTTAELTHLITESIQTALNSLLQKKPFTLGTRFSQLERQRLTKLIQSWLKMETSRAPFTVMTLEQTEKFQFGAIPLVLRTDRLDQLDSGEQIIIDYKTGHPAISDWFGERPTDPQLPLYCVASSRPIQGIYFAQIRSDKYQFKGVAASSLNMPGTASLPLKNDHGSFLSWDELVCNWRHTLTQLSAQIQTGYAKIDPKEGDKTCAFCDLQALCRITEHGNTVL